MKKGKLVKFDSKGPKPSNKDGEIVDHGKLGNLEYELYKRGTIHIFSKSLTFKKDPDLFEDAVCEIDFDTMENGDTAVIKGSGDNDNLVFICTESGIEIKLVKRGHDILSKLKSLITKGKSNKEGN